MAFAGVGDAAGRAGRLPVCVHRRAAVLPVGDAQDVAGPGVAGATAGYGWHLGAGADPGTGGGPCAGAGPAPAGAPPRARDDPGTPGAAVSGRPPATECPHRAPPTSHP